MASSEMLTEKLILALNSAKDFIKSEDSQIVKKLMNSLNNNKESFSDDFTIDGIKAAVEERQQERANEDEVILGVEPAEETTEESAEETTEEPAEETTEESAEETKEDEDIMSKFKWVLISIGIFVFLIIVGSIFYWYFSSQPEETIMQPKSNIQPITTTPPSQNIEVEPVQNYSYLPFTSSSVSNTNKSNELEKQKQERKNIEQEADIKRIEEQRMQEEQRIQEEKGIQEEQRMQEEQRIQEDKRMQEEQRIQEEQGIQEDKRMQEEQRIQEEQRMQEKLIKQSLDDDKNNSNISSSTAYTDKSSSSSESSDDNKQQKKGGKPKKLVKQVKQVKQVAKRKYVKN